MRFLLAFACFFRLLFTGRLPVRAASYLPEGARPELPTAPPASSTPAATPTIEGAVRPVVVVHEVGRERGQPREDRDHRDHERLAPARAHRGAPPSM